MDEKELQFAIFKLGDLEFGIDIMKVKEITRYHKISKIPGTPPFIEGVINLRGVIIPIVDLRKKFGMEPREPDKKTRIIVATILKRIAGLLVDEVIEVLRIPAENLKPPPQLGESFKADFLSGVAEKGEEIIFIIDFEKLLSQKEQVDFSKFHEMLSDTQMDNNKPDSEDSKQEKQYSKSTRKSSRKNKKKKSKKSGDSNEE